MSRLCARSPRGDDAGSAIVEFVFVAVVVMVPLVYLLVSVAIVQRNQLAVSQAAREAGRAIATTDSASDLPRRVAAAVHIALRSQGIADDVAVRIVAPGATCTSVAVPPVLAAGAELTVCVTREVQMPAVPSVLAGRGIRCVGRYTVHVDDYRTVRP